MSEQISNGTAFNIYYSENNIPYNNTDIKIIGARSGIIVCKDDLSYNLLFVNESGTPYLLSDDVNKFTAVRPIILNDIKNGKEREIKLNYDTSDSSLLTVNDSGQLIVNTNQLNNNYASKHVETDITKLNKDIISLQQENISLKSQIDVLNRRFNALNIDKDEYKPAYLDIWLKSSQDQNKLCIRKKDNKDITYNYTLQYSGEIKINLYSTYSCLENNEYNWNDNYDFVKQITTYSGPRPNIVQKDNNAYILIKNAYLKNTQNKYHYIYSNNLNQITDSYFNKFDETYNGYIGNKDLGNERVSYAYNLSSNQIDINRGKTINLQYFSNSRFADYPFEYIENKKTFNTYNYYPVSKFSINIIDNFNIYNESPTGLKIICSYFNNNNEVKFAYYIKTTIGGTLSLEKHIKKLSSIQIYPCIYNSYYGINSNLKLSSNRGGNITFQDIKPETGSSQTISYTLNFDNVSYLEFKFSEKSYNNKMNFQLYLDLSTTNNKNTIPRIISINKDSYNYQFNKFPTDISTNMPGVKIYTNNTNQSKVENIKLYNNAKEWRRIHILNNGLNNTDTIRMLIDELVIDDKTIDEYDNNYNYRIDIDNTFIELQHKLDNTKVLTISSDGSVSNVNLPTTPIAPTPAPTSTPKPTQQMYTLKIIDSNTNEIIHTYQQDNKYFEINDITYKSIRHTDNVHVDQISDNILMVTILDGFYTGGIYVDMSTPAPQEYTLNIIDNNTQSLINQYKQNNSRFEISGITITYDSIKDSSHVELHWQNNILSVAIIRTGYYTGSIYVDMPVNNNTTTTTTTAPPPKPTPPSAPTPTTTR